MSTRLGACNVTHRPRSSIPLKKDPAYDGVTFFRVDYDRQKAVVAKLDCPRSTLDRLQGGQGGRAHVLGNDQGLGSESPEGRDVNPLLAVQLAFAAGMLTIFSPCVLPLAPIVIASARAEDPLGPIALGLGMALTFGVVGGFSPRSASSSATRGWCARPQARSWS